MYIHKDIRVGPFEQLPSRERKIKRGAGRRCDHGDSWHLDAATCRPAIYQRLRAESHRIALVLLVLYPTALIVAQGREIESHFDLSLLGQSWSLRLPLRGFLIAEDRNRTDRSMAMVVARSEASGITVSAYLEAEASVMTADQCRAIYWTRAVNRPIPKTNVHAYRTRGQERGEYFVESYRGQHLRQHNIHAYLSEGTTCVDVHVSKIGFEGAADLPALEAILDGLTVEQIR